jgi:hypothetical protein
MKNILKPLVFLIIAAGFFWTGCATTKTKTAKYVGSWDYVVKNLPDGDINGIMEIGYSEDAFTGDIKSDDGNVSIKVEDLKIEEDKLSGYFYFQGMKIYMDGTFDGENYTGKISVDYNDFPMTATKIN